jgi:polyvinyl alcohol dehydrogenase (cytochrome)
VAHGALVAGSGGGTVFALDPSTGRLRWKRDLNKPINGSAAISGRLVYVPLATPGKPSVAALDLKTGKRRWERVVDRQKNADVFGSPTVARGKVLIGVSGEFGEVNDPKVSVRGSVVALDARKGRLRWKRYMVPKRFDGGAVWNTPAVEPSRGIVYVGTGNAYHEPAAKTTDSIVALRLKDGRVLRHFQATAGDVWNGTDNRTGAGPDHDFGASLNLMRDPANHALIGAGQKSGVYWAFDRRTLKPVWNVTTAPPGTFVGGIVGSTAYDGKRVYGPDTPSGEIWAVDAGAGSLAWASSDGDPLHFGPVATGNGIVYSSDMGGNLTARESGTGAVLAKLPLGSPTWGGVSLAGGYVFAVTGTQGTTGYIVAYRPRG